jgi:hypothetical protein
MDFIERLFGMSPDGGNGTYELLLFAVVMLLVAYVARRRRQATQRLR